jgi:RNA polymerase sigma-70 factor (ECF subfamily)
MQASSSPVPRAAGSLRLLTAQEPPPPDPALDALLQRAYRYALSLTHDPDDARDLVQEACLSIARRGGPWSAGYVLTSVRNRFIDSTRRTSHPSRALEDDDAVTLPADTFPEEPEHRALHGALGLLRDDEREVIFLHAVEAFSASEIAALTGRPRGTILSLLHRTKAKLRAALGPAVPATPLLP